MIADPQPPAAIRITRPYATEDEYLQHDLETLTRTSITLIGAQWRPEGVVVRFELVLTGGQVILRGEGRVIGLRPSAAHGGEGHAGAGQGDQGGSRLSLRFTRLDARSKALIDRAAALREKRRPSNRADPSPRTSTAGQLGSILPVPPLDRPPAARGTMPLPPPTLDGPESAPDSATPPSTSGSSPVIEPFLSSLSLDSPPSSRPPAPMSDRDALLARLRRRRTQPT